MKRDRDDADLQGGSLNKQARPHMDGGVGHAAPAIAAALSNPQLYQALGNASAAGYSTQSANTGYQQPATDVNALLNGMTQAQLQQLAALAAGSTNGTAASMQAQASTGYNAAAPAASSYQASGYNTSSYTAQPAAAAAPAPAPAAAAAALNPAVITALTQSLGQAGAITALTAFLQQGSNQAAANSFASQINPVAAAAVAANVAKPALQQAMGAGLGAMGGPGMNTAAMGGMPYNQQPMPPPGMGNMANMGNMGSMPNMQAMAAMSAAPRPGIAMVDPTSLPADARDTIYVDTLPQDISKRELAHIFRPFEGYRNVRLIVRDSIKKAGEKVTMGFIEFTSPYLATVAMHTLQGYPLDLEHPDRDQLKISYAHRKHESGSRNQGGGGGGRNQGHRR